MVECICTPPSLFLEMRATDKVTFVNTFYGANLGAFAAVYAKLVIYGRKVVYNLNCAGRASLFALHTANTAV